MNFSAVLQDIPWRKHFHRNYLYLTGIVCGIVLGRDLPGIYLAALLLTALTIWLIRSKLYREVLMLLLAAAAGLLAVYGIGVNCARIAEALPAIQIQLEQTR